jgi:prepilin-type N-terminal cleavage/methylation domain-containing protein
MKSQKTKGFTLIELLVVIAIIGILASIVLVSFPGATKKAKDSRVMSAIGQARTVMSYVYARDNSYTNFSCANTEDIMDKICAEIQNNSYNQTAPTTYASTDAACIYAPLNVKNGTTWYCADSTGVAGTATVDPGGTGYCDGTTFVCPPVSG